MKKWEFLLSVLLICCMTIGVYAESLSPQNYTQYSKEEQKEASLPRTYSSFLSAISDYYDKWSLSGAFVEPYLQAKQDNEWVYVNSIQGFTIVTQPSETGRLKMIMVKLRRDYNGYIRDESLVSMLSTIAALEYEMPASASGRSVILSEVGDTIAPNMLLLSYMVRGDEKYFMGVTTDVCYSWFLDDNDDLFFVVRFSAEE